MFRKDLKRRLEKIFGFEKTSFDAPSDEFEQDVLFVAIQNVKTRVSNLKGGREIARVVGYFVVYSQGDRLPYGYFNKRIESADRFLTDDLYFYDIDTDIPESPARLQNIHERRVSFIFLYDAQYDPNRGELTSLDERYDTNV